MHPMAKSARKIVSLMGADRSCVTYAAMRRSPRIVVSIVVGVRFMVEGPFGQARAKVKNVAFATLCCAQSQNRTGDLPLFRRMLFQLSYQGLSYFPSICMGLDGSQVPSSPATRVMLL